MAVERTEVEETIRAFLHRARKPTDFTPETILYADGLGLDSLEAAELSVALEDAFETDPFSASDVPPTTIGEVLDFYA